MDYFFAETKFKRRWKEFEREGLAAESVECFAVRETKGSGVYIERNGRYWGVSFLRF